MQILNLYPHILYRNNFDEKDKTKDFFSFQSKIKKLSKEFDDYTLQVLISAWCDSINEFDTLDTKFVAENQYIYYDVRLTRFDGFTYLGAIHTNVNYALDSLDLNSVQTTVGNPTSTIIEVYNKILIDSCSKNRAVTIEYKDDPSKKYIAIIPQNEIYQIYNTGKYYIWGDWRDHDVANWDKIQQVIDLLLKINFIRDWELKEIIGRIKQKPYGHLLLLLLYMRNKAIFVNFSLYCDNGSISIIIDYIKDLAKISLVSIEEIDESFDEEKDILNQRVKFSGKWFDFSNIEFVLAQKFNEVLEYLNSDGRIYQLEDEVSVAYVNFTEAQKEEVEKSGLFKVNVISNLV